MSAPSAVAEPFEIAGKRIFVAGHRGMVGSALLRRLAGERCEVLTAGRAEVDLRRQQPVEDWMAAKRPEVVIIAAATVGGILANSTRPAEFLYDNLAIAGNLIEACHRNRVAKVLYLGSSCIYPKLAPQPLVEDSLLTGPLEPTNEWYAVAKIAGIKLCQAYRKQYGCSFISAMPTNLYGPGDNFDLASSHVVPALMRKIDAAKRNEAEAVEIWGSGTPRREFLYVDDVADACLYLLRHYDGYDHVNIGVGWDLTIRELAETIAKVVGYRGGFAYDRSKPDGTPQKLLDVSRLTALGWRARTSLEEGLRLSYDWYRAHHQDAA
jgi:GDP-L-fucose synthase